MTGRMQGLVAERWRRELLSLRWRTTERGVRQMEPKEEARKRGVASPDGADSLMLAFAPLYSKDVLHDQTFTYEPDSFEISPF